MQQIKRNKTFTEINDYCKNDSRLVHIFNNLLQDFDLRYINSLFLMRFINFDNIHQLMQSGISNELNHKKDVFYDFLNNPKINWRNILWLFTKQALKLSSIKSIDEKNNHPKYLIIKDSILPKTRKTIVLLGKVYDHGTHFYKLGMKILTLGYNDGKSFTPFRFFSTPRTWQKW